MSNIRVNVVGSSSDPIKVYWDVKNTKSDENLLLMSICSGAYGYEYIDKDTFVELCNKFFRYCKKDKKYNEQFKYVILNGKSECVSYLQSKLLNTWNVVIDCYEEEKVILA